VDRQKTIFENQLREANKPQMQWEKILTGKFNKWYSEVCLLKQESIITPKTSVEQIIKQVSEKLGGEIYIVNFVRCQVGEGLEPKKANNFSQEVAKLSGMTMLLTKEPALLKPNVE
jgi:elongation factor Ts